MEASAMLKVVEQNFDKLDKNRDGKMNLEEFTVVVHIVLPDASDSQISDIFAKFDEKDPDGKLTKYELMKGVAALFGGVKEIMGVAFDEHAGDDGKMHKAELQAFFKEQKVNVTAKNMDTFFSDLDKNDDGYFSKDEVLALF